MAGQFGRLGFVLLVAWVVLFVGFFVFVLYPENKLDAAATKREALRVYSNSKFYRELEKPAEFGLEKLSSVVNYLLLATAAVLAFITKSLMDVRSERAKPDATAASQLKRWQYLLLLHAGIACLFSLVWGVVAYLTLPDVAFVETLAVTGVLSRCAIGQIIGLLFAVVLLLVALGGIVRDLLP